MLYSTVDHLVVTSPSLAAGVDYVERTLGVAMQPGGEHPRMGTHNKLLRLGARVYLEVIAVDPHAPPPARPRWFGLDDAAPHAQPRLATWVARTNDIRAAVAASGLDLGQVEPMSRGALSWLITVPANGRPLLDGIAPALIEWPDGVHPAEGLEDRGCRLVRLKGFHAEAKRIEATLARIGFEGDFTVAPLPAGEAPRLIAEIETPGGLRQRPMH